MKRVKLVIHVDQDSLAEFVGIRHRTSSIDPDKLRGYLVDIVESYFAEVAEDEDALHQEEDIREGKRLLNEWRM